MAVGAEAKDRRQHTREGGPLAGPPAFAELPAELVATMTRLHEAGFSLLPLGGANGKTPLVKFKGRRRLPLPLVINRMAEAGSGSYGIRLNRLLVIDVDEDSDAARAYVEHRFGSSPFRVRTRRGYHLYFRHAGPRPKNIRGPGIAIDVKAGANDYVVGPLSTRPDRTTYRSEGELLSPENMPRFVDLLDPEVPAPVVNSSGLITEGYRHSALKRRAYDLAINGYPLADLTGDLLAWRNNHFDRPEDFSDERVAGMARWYCDIRDAGQLWRGSHSMVPIARSAIDLLLTYNDGLVTQLYMLLCSAHGHRAYTPFAIVPDALRAAGRLKAGRRQIYRAIACLTELGLLVVALPSRRPKDPVLYLLAPMSAQRTGGGGEV